MIRQQTSLSCQKKHTRARSAAAVVKPDGWVNYALLMTETPPLPHNNSVYTILSSQ